MAKAYLELEEIKKMERVKIKGLTWIDAKDPTFNAGEAHTGTATLTNQTGQALTVTTELFLDVSKVVTSGRSSAFTIPAGGSVQVSYQIVMPPAAGGPYHVYLGVWSGTTLLTLYQGTDDVTVQTPPVPFTYQNLTVSGYNAGYGDMGVDVECDIVNNGPITQTYTVTLWGDTYDPYYGVPYVGKDYGWQSWAGLPPVYASWSGTSVNPGYTPATDPYYQQYNPGAKDWGQFSLTLGPGQSYHYKFMCAWDPNGHYGLGAFRFIFQLKDSAGGQSAQANLQL